MRIFRNVVVLLLAMMLVAGVLIGCDHRIPENPNSGQESGGTTSGGTTGGETSGGTTGGETGSEEPGTGSETEPEATTEETQAKAVADAFEGGVCYQNLYDAVKAAGPVVGTTIEDTPEFRTALAAELSGFPFAFKTRYESATDVPVPTFNFSDGLLHVKFNYPMEGDVALSEELMQNPDGTWYFKEEEPDGDERYTTEVTIKRDEHGNLYANSNETGSNASTHAITYKGHHMLKLEDNDLTTNDLVMESRNEDGSDYQKLHWFDLTQSTSPDTLLKESKTQHEGNKTAKNMYFQELDSANRPIFYQVREYHDEDTNKKEVTVQYYDPWAFCDELDNAFGTFTYVSFGDSAIRTALEVVRLESDASDQDPPTPFCRTVNLEWNYADEPEATLKFGRLELTALIAQSVEEATNKLLAAGFTKNGDDLEKKAQNGTDIIHVRLNESSSEDDRELIVSIDKYPTDATLKDFVDGWINQLKQKRDSVSFSFD